VSKTATIVMARWGERAESPAINTYHFVDVFQVRGKWVYPDIGYVDFGHINYREFFAGGGYSLLNGKHVAAVGELLYEQALGPPLTMIAGLSHGQFCSIGSRPSWAAKHRTLLMRL